MHAAAIRWMTRSDLDDVMDIERRSFPHPWTLDDFMVTLKLRNVIGKIIERDEITLGYVIYAMHRGYLEIINLAIDPVFRRDGLGTQLINDLHLRLSLTKRQRLTAIVHEPNLSAQLFFREHGFNAVETLRDYVIDEYGGGDAYRFELHRHGRIGNHLERIPEGNANWADDIFAEAEGDR